MLPRGCYDGHVVLVTGGGTGLGRAMAVEFARLGAGVVVASRKEEHRANGIRAVQEAGGRAIGVAVDVRDAAQVAAAFDAAEQQLGPVSVLVNNDAGNFPVAAETLSANGWRAVVYIVLPGTFLMSADVSRRRLR